MGVHVRFLWNVRILLFASDTAEREPFLFDWESKFPGKLVSSVAPRLSMEENNSTLNEKEREREREREKNGRGERERKK